MNDTVNHPAHYTSGKKEFLDVAKDMLSEEEFIGGIKFNIFIYIFRSEFKNGVEDLLKAEFYLKYLIKLKKGE